MTKVNVLYVDDDQPNLDLFELTVGDRHRVITVNNAADGLAIMEREDVGVVVTDQVMPGTGGVQFLETVCQRHPNTVRIVLTAYQEVELLLGAINAGHVSDYVLKPWEPQELLALLDRAAEQYLRRRALELRCQEHEYLASELRSRYDPAAIVGSTGGLEEVIRLARAVAPTSSTVLLLGETGTGKELVARAIHAMSERRERTIIKLDCASLAPGLLESELFGHVRGAFTGAIREKKGRFELAHEGTLFLDEVGEIPLELQPKLLRVLQDRQLERLGGEATINVDVRVIAATNQDLERRVAAGTFRRDLYYRLAVVPIRLPPLRDRLDDLQRLVVHFLRKHGGWKGMRMSITEAALAKLRTHPWPGNVRELENMVERALLVSRTEAIDADAFTLPAPSAAEDDGDDGVEERLDLRGLARRQQRDALQRAVVEAGGNLSRAARGLGLPRSTLISRLKRQGLLT